MQPDLIPLADAMSIDRLFQVEGCVAENIRFKNSVSCYDRRLPYVCYQHHTPGKLAIVASGPSAKDYLPDLRKWQGDIWGINGAFNWIRSEGVKANAFIGLDPEPFLVDYLKETPFNATYYIASQCDPGVFDRLSDNKVRTWHSADPDVLPPRGQYQIPGGQTCLSRSLYLASLMGWMDIHVFGGDSSYEGEDEYAYGGKVFGCGQCFVEVDGTKYRTNRQFFTQAVEMVEIIKDFPGSVTIHGRGLLVAIAEQSKPAFDKLQRKLRKRAA